MRTCVRRRTETLATRRSLPIALSRILAAILIVAAVAVLPVAVRGQGPTTSPQPQASQSAGNQSAAPTATANSPAETPQQTAEQVRLINWMIGITIGFGVASFLLVALIAGRVQKTFWNKAGTDSDRDWRTYLMQLPLAIPEGSVRALASLFVIMFGLLALVLQKQLELSNVDAISGFVGIVITFYFTARGNEQAQRTTDAAQKATDAAQKAADQASHAVSQSQSVVASAAQSVANATAAAALRSAGGDAVALLTGQSGDGIAKLRSLRDELQTARQLFGALDALDRGPDIVPDADKMAADADSLLATIESLLAGSPAPASVAGVSQQAEQMIERLRNGGFQGLIASAMATVEATLGPLKANVQALCGGSAGLVAGIVQSGVGLLGQPQKFDDWVSVLVRQPYGPGLAHMVPDGNLARQALTLSPLMIARLNADQATDLMQRILGKNQNGELTISSDLAAQLAAVPGYKMPDDFASEQELVQAIEEYRSVLEFVQSHNRLESQADISGVGPEQTPITVSLQSMADLCFQLGADPRDAAEFERLAFAVQALAKLPIAADKLSQIALDAVREAIAIARDNREQSDARGGGAS